MTLPPSVGEVFEAEYPFIRETYGAFQGDEDGAGYEAGIPTWKPGTRNESDGEGDCYSLADALGKVVLTVVSLHKPATFPMRVFFLRSWVTPEGKAFGKRKLRMATVGAFRTLTAGYRHEYVLAGCDCDGCEYPTNDHRKRGRFAPQEPQEARPADRESAHTGAGE